MFKSREEMHDHWTNYAQKHLMGKTIAKVRMLTQSETDCLHWPSGTLVIELDDGTLLYPSADDERNGPGALAGQSAQGEELLFPVICPLEVDG
tara:strand:+ start:469 stop:747 length:279 start_codon:yes stop_codon:yes gene_type:complete